MDLTSFLSPLGVLFTNVNVSFSFAFFAFASFFLDPSCPHCGFSFFLFLPLANFFNAFLESFFSPLPSTTVASVVVVVGAAAVAASASAAAFARKKGTIVY